MQSENGDIFYELNGYNAYWLIWIIKVKVIVEQEQWQPKMLKMRSQKPKNISSATNAASGSSNLLSSSSAYSLWALSSEDTRHHKKCSILLSTNIPWKQYGCGSKVLYTTLRLHHRHQSWKDQQLPRRILTPHQPSVAGNGRRMLMQQHLQRLHLLICTLGISLLT